MMGVMGNKGATVVRLSLYDSTICFVCAHMAAKRANVQGRNSDFWSILSKTAFAGDPETAWWVISAIDGPLLFPLGFGISWVGVMVEGCQEWVERAGPFEYLRFGPVG